MKNTDKNSRTNNNTLIYILLFLLLVVAIGCGTYYFVGRKSRILAENIAHINDESNLEKDTSLSDKMIASKIEGVKLKKKRCGEKILTNNKLSSEEINAYKNVLATLNNKVLELDEWKLMKIEDKEEKEKIIHQVFKENQRLDRLELKIDPEISKRVVKFYRQEQPEWEKKTFPNESQIVIKKIDETFTPFFHKFRQELIRNGEEKATVEEIIEPKVINGEQTTSANLQKHINFVKTQQVNVKNGTTHKVRKMKPGPLELRFLGFTDFLGAGEKDEGTITLGITECEGKFPWNHNEEVKTKFFAWCHPIDGPAEARIKLKKELLFSRLGENYDRWITEFKETKNGSDYKYSDISWETLIETIAHELAHAVIDSVKWKYEDSDGEGHGPLHSNYTKRIRKMIEASPEYEKFAQFWKEKW